VVDFGQLIAGPAVGRSLAALGADVVKVEPVGGETARSTGTYGAAIFATNNRGKRSIALDLGRPDGRDVARRLVEHADVVVQNMRPGTMERLGLGPADVAELNPRAVYASVTGFGTSGPHRDRPGLDIAAQAESGMMSITGAADGDPQRVGFTVVDVATADLLTQAILAALLRRHATGVGGHVEISLLEVAYHLQASLWAEFGISGVEPRRSGNPQPTVAPASDLVSVADGHIVVSAYSQQHWARLCGAIGRPELVDDPRFADNAARVAHRTNLAGVLARALGALTRDQAVDLLVSHGVVAGAVRGFADAARAEQAEALGIFRPVAYHGSRGTLRVPRLPYAIDGWSDADAPPPSVGEHTTAILTELGYDAKEIAALVASGALGADAVPAPTAG